MPGFKIFETNGIFEPVAGVTYKIIAIGPGGSGGGGGGGARAYENTPPMGGSGGKGSNGRLCAALWTAPNDSAVAVTVGQPGAPGQGGAGLASGYGNADGNPGTGGGNGSASSFGAVVSAPAGVPGTGAGVRRYTHSSSSNANGTNGVLPGSIPSGIGYPYLTDITSGWGVGGFGGNGGSSKGDTGGYSYATGGGTNGTMGTQGVVMVMW